MDEATIDREAMGRLAKALVFVCGADHPTTVALKTAQKAVSSVISRMPGHCFSD